MNRRGLFKGLAALAGVGIVGPVAVAHGYARGGPVSYGTCRVGERGQEFVIPTAGRSGSLRSADPVAWRGARWYLDTPTNSALPTRFVVEADQFRTLA